MVRIHFLCLTPRLCFDCIVKSGDKWAKFYTELAADENTGGDYRRGIACVVIIVEDCVAILLLGELFLYHFFSILKNKITESIYQLYFLDFFGNAVLAVYPHRYSYLVLAFLASVD